MGSEVELLTAKECAGKEFNLSKSQEQLDNHDKSTISVVLKPPEINYEALDDRDEKKNCIFDDLNVCEGCINCSSCSKVPQLVARSNKYNGAKMQLSADDDLKAKMQPSQNFGRRVSGFHKTALPGTNLFSREYPTGGCHAEYNTSCRCGARPTLCQSSTEIIPFSSSPSGQNICFCPIHSTKKLRPHTTVYKCQQRCYHCAAPINISVLSHGFCGSHGCKTNEYYKSATTRTINVQEPIDVQGNENIHTAQSFEIYHKRAYHPKSNCHKKYRSSNHAEAKRPTGTRLGPKCTCKKVKLHHGRSPTADGQMASSVASYKHKTNHKTRVANIICNSSTCKSKRNVKRCRGCGRYSSFNLPRNRSSNAGNYSVDCYRYNHAKRASGVRHSRHCKH